MMKKLKIEMFINMITLNGIKKGVKPKNGIVKDFQKKIGLFSQI